MTRLLIFVDDEAGAWALIARIDKEMGFPNETTKTWQDELVQHPTKKGQVGVWVKDRVGDVLSTHEKEEQPWVVNLYANGWFEKPTIQTTVRNLVDQFFSLWGM